MMSMTAIRVSRKLANADEERISNAARKREKFFFGLPEPSFDIRLTKAFIDKNVNADDLCDQCLLPKNIRKRNK